MTLHEITLQEWETRTPDQPELAGLELSEPARELARQLTQTRRLEVVELRQGLQIRSLSYVGRITLGPLRITIRPKLDTAVLLRLLCYAYGLRDLDVLNRSDYDSLVDTFQNLLIFQLVMEVRELLSRGIHRRYQPKQESLSSPRGRIDIQTLARQGGVLSSELPCVYYHRSEDNLLNRTVLAGLHFAAQLTDDIWLRTQVRRTVKMLDNRVERVQLEQHVLRRAQRELDRMTDAYRPALTLIELLYAGQGSRLSEGQDINLQGFLFDMNAFWERLLSRFLRENLVGYVLHDQYKLSQMLRYVQSPKQRRHHSPRPDYAVTRDGEVMAILDAKYRDIWARGLPRDMLYQLTLYAASQGDGGQATILYPTTNARAETEVIEMRDILGSRRYVVRVVLQPVLLSALATLIRNGTQRQREQYAVALIFRQTDVPKP